MHNPTIALTIYQTPQDKPLVLHVSPNVTLRDALLQADLSPYGTLTHKLNCGGRGLCATCGVWIKEDPPPAHWHDVTARKYGYPRLSCQIKVTHPMTVSLIKDKIIWGKILPTWPKAGHI